MLYTAKRRNQETNTKKSEKDSWSSNMIHKFLTTLLEVKDEEDFDVGIVMERLVG